MTWVAYITGYWISLKMYKNYHNLDRNTSFSQSWKKNTFWQSNEYLLLLCWVQPFGGPLLSFLIILDFKLDSDWPIGLGLASSSKRELPNSPLCSVGFLILTCLEAFSKNAVQRKQYFESTFWNHRTETGKGFWSGQSLLSIITFWPVGAVERALQNVHIIWEGVRGIFLKLRIDVVSFLEAYRIYFRCHFVFEVKTLELNWPTFWIPRHFGNSSKVVCSCLYPRCFKKKIPV